MMKYPTSIVQFIEKILVHNRIRQHTVSKSNWFVFYIIFANAKHSSVLKF